MSKNHTEIYHLIDNSFISGFSESHIEYMKSYYYRNIKSRIFKGLIGKV